jgi:hypothetical protein
VKEVTKAKVYPRPDYEALVVLTEATDRLGDSVIVAVHLKAIDGRMEETGLTVCTVGQIISLRIGRNKDCCSQGATRLFKRGDSATGRPPLPTSPPLLH